MKHSLSAILLCLSATAAAGADPKEKYVVVTLVEKGDPYHAAAERLATLRGGEVVDAQIERLSALRDVFREKQPKYVAYVVRPEQFDINLARACLKIATQVDSDPFIDFSYGFITGDTAEAAAALAESGTRAEAKRKKPELAIAAVGEKVVTQSAVATQGFPLRKGTLPVLWGQIAGGENFPGKGRDAKFIQKLMPQLQGKPIVMFAGHGYPREVVGGPLWSDLAGVKFDGAAVLNIACYTGVTGKWYEEDWLTGSLRRKTVPPEESFCLAMLRTGVGGYVAYACPRPAGPEMFSDATALSTEGISMGELRRRDYNRVVLAYIAEGHKELDIRELADGQPIRPAENLVKDLMLDMATGGVLFGDPAFRPFAPRPDEVPAPVVTERKGDHLLVTLKVGEQHLFFQCSEPLATWGEQQQPTLRMLAIVPLGDDFVASVDVKELKLGRDTPPHRLVWAVEENEGGRFLHAKAVFPMPEPDKVQTLAGGASATFAVQTTRDPANARLRYTGKK